MVQVFDNKLIDSLTDMTTAGVNAEKDVGFMTQLLCWDPQSLFLRLNSFQNI